ncbi:hypothetical protein D3C71_2218030 [compost metagenome]
MDASELALTAFNFVTRELGPVLLVIGAISVADLFIWFLIRMFKQLPFKGKFKW